MTTDEKVINNGGYYFIKKTCDWPSKIELRKLGENVI